MLPNVYTMLLVYRNPYVRIVFPLLFFFYHFIIFGSYFRGLREKEFERALAALDDTDYSEDGDDIGDLDDIDYYPTLPVRS